MQLRALRLPNPPAPATRARLANTLLGLCADVLSGTGGLASWLRQTQLAGTPAAGPSLPLNLPIPLDTGAAEPTIPAHLRRAVLARHRTCAFPGCPHPARGCHLHHLIPRSHGGPTALWNLAPACEFHHLVVIHSWGWTLRLNPDGTTTATSPDHTRTLHSHRPPQAA
ncbi:MAG TPA: HNH endonuclease signature motif containing protein [Streptosporangiaceae bacterium]